MLEIFEGLEYECHPQTLENPRNVTQPLLRLFRVKELEREEEVLKGILVEREVAQEDYLQGLSELLEGIKYEC